MVTKQEYGKQYSSKYLNDFTDMETELGILSAYTQIGSEDSLFPKDIKYTIKSKTQGWNVGNTVSTYILINEQQQPSFFFDVGFL